MRFSPFADFGLGGRFGQSIAVVLNYDAGLFADGQGFAQSEELLLLLLELRIF